MFNATIEQACNKVDSEIASCEAIISEFKDNFDKNPLYALEWADNCYLAVANMGMLRDVRNVLKFAKENPNHSSVIEFESHGGVLDGLDYSMSNHLRGNRLSSSTSASHRMMNTANAEVASEWFSTSMWGSTVNRRYVVKVLTSLSSVPFDVVA